MFKIKVDGKVIEGREFQNMPQALAFAFQNGQCHCAKTLEIAEEKVQAPKPEPKPEQPKVEPKKSDPVVAENAITETAPDPVIG